MKMEKIKLYKLYYFDDCSHMYYGILGLYHFFDELLEFVKSQPFVTDFDLLEFRSLNFIKIPFFGYYSPQFTGFDPRALAGTRRPGN